MADADAAIEWDFFTLVDEWNLYGLPALLVVVVIALAIRCRSRPALTGWIGGWRTVLLVGLIHCALAFQAWISLAQEVLVWGQSFISPVGAFFSSIVNPLLAIGLLRRGRWARRFAIAWYAILMWLAIVVAVWLVYYRVPVGMNAWPEQAVSKTLPFFLFAVMLVPRIKRVFSAPVREASPNAKPSSEEGKPAAPEAPAGWPIGSLLTLLYLIVVCSNLVVSAADWGHRLIFDSESLP